MHNAPITTLHNALDTLPALTLPAIITDAGDNAAFRFVEFFTATIRNKNTRAAYFNAVQRFCIWCDLHGLALEQVNPVHVAAYIEQLGQERSIPTVKQHLSAINRLMDFLVTGQVIPINPRPFGHGPQICRQSWQNPCSECGPGQKVTHKHRHRPHIGTQGPRAHRPDGLQLCACRSGTCHECG